MPVRATVYDGDGNQIPVSGTFPGINKPDDISWDPVTGNIYVVNVGNNAMTVYDPDGNLLTTSGSFLGLNSPDQIVSDGNSLSPLYFVANLGTVSFGSYLGDGQITVYDRSGNPAVSGWRLSWSLGTCRSSRRALV